MSTTPTVIKTPTKAELDSLLTLISNAISEENIRSGNGSKPRAVALRLVADSSLMRSFIPFLANDKLPLNILYAVTDLWDKSREDRIDYYLEIYNEFKLGLTFLDEAISY